MKLTSLHERWLILLIVAHTAGVGCILLFVPEWGLRFGGWKEGINPLFFARQAGIFHFVLVCGYLIEYFRYRGVSLLVTAKTIALVFLLLMAVIDDVPWAVPFSGVADGAMGLVAFLVHRRVGAQAG
jgi:hypothetical protein